MKRIPDETCASICGLFCGACPSFPDECHGCLSDFVREGCKNCEKHGFLTARQAIKSLVAMSAKGSLAIN